MQDSQLVLMSSMITIQSMIGGFVTQ
uniref:Uncharacterized protein n=1 Tax=Arundo donax TaxID=35708 RepID=A0A0A9A885_ARUDO